MNCRIESSFWAYDELNADSFIVLVDLNNLSYGMDKSSAKEANKKHGELGML